MFGPTEGQNEQWREADRHRHRPRATPAPPSGGHRAHPWTGHNGSQPLPRRPATTAALTLTLKRSSTPLPQSGRTFINFHGPWRPRDARRRIMRRTEKCRSGSHGRWVMTIVVPVTQRGRCPRHRGGPDRVDLGRGDKWGVGVHCDVIVVGARSPRLNGQCRGCPHSTGVFLFFLLRTVPKDRPQAVGYWPPFGGFQPTTSDCLALRLYRGLRCGR